MRHHPNNIYATEVTFADVISDIENHILPIFDNAAIQNLHAFDHYFDTQAIVAYSKAVQLKLLIYHQLVMLGAPGRYNDMAKQLASEAHRWLKARYDYHSSGSSYIGVVAESSTPWSSQFGQARSLPMWQQVMVSRLPKQVYIRSSCRADALYLRKPLKSCFQSVGGNQDTKFAYHNCDWVDCNYYSYYHLPWDSKSPCNVDYCWQGTYNNLLSEAADKLAG